MIKHRSHTTENTISTYLQVLNHEVFQLEQV